MNGHSRSRETPTIVASVSQCRGCGLRRPLRMSTAYDKDGECSCTCDVVQKPVFGTRAQMGTFQARCNLPARVGTGNLPRLSNRCHTQHRVISSTVSARYDGERILSVHLLIPTAEL